MSYLICINEKSGEVLHPEVVKLCDSFSVLNNKEMLYVALYADYNSIYKQFPEYDRKRRAMFHAFGDNEPDLVESPRILLAVKDYTSLQYNPKIELVRRYHQKINKLLDVLDTEEKPSDIEKTTKAINALRENIRSLEYEVSEEQKTEGVIRGDRQLSFLEKLQGNKKIYKSVVSKK